MLRLVEKLHENQRLKPGPIAFSSEVATGSREENTSKQ
jgi:hypothetical protein